MERIKAIRKAADIASQTMGFAREQEAVGMTEKELAEMIDERMRELGASRNAFDTIVGAGENGAEIHHVPDDRVICEGEPVVIDLGCVYNEYCSDMTRTVVFGGSPGEKYREVFEAVKESQRKAISAVRAGVNARDVDAAARDYLEEKGWGKNFVHSTGHGVGKKVHEKPSLSPGSEDKLEEGNVVTIEPGVYIEGEFGVRIEDLMVVREEDYEILGR
ncbi:M24 family metallopeptidase [Candidatus Nanohalococcus occultus]|uniref:Xaa-Pro aminopeptidase n=1 Tax=Candidatus Nanohalococcus occultus TaxID=2978047 RepID=A0ABY8CCX0_9ARCH|nr:Xaa-Pro aminopeptidase [Candidatus Nanohaloarchaeota archaeon SVXNc]